MHEADPVDGAVGVGPRGRVAVGALVDDRSPESQGTVVWAREVLESLGTARDLEEEADDVVLGVGEDREREKRSERRRRRWTEGEKKTERRALPNDDDADAKQL